MPLISIVTSVQNEGRDYLLEAYESLCSQTMPTGWDWEWIVQEDGKTGVPASALPDDDRISTGTGHQGGAAMTRSLAMSRVQGQFVRVLDADGLLPPGALERAITALTQERNVAWCVSACLGLLPDGSLCPGPDGPPAGPLVNDALIAAYKSGRFPVVGTTMTAYTDLVHAMGGWPVFPAADDVALLLLCEAVSQGWMIDEPGAIYRKHSEQEATQPGHWDPTVRAELDEILLPRLEALRSLDWHWSPSQGFTGRIA